MSRLDDFQKEIKATWPELSTSLAKFANTLLKDKYFARGNLPEGYTVEDLVFQAVSKTLEGLKTDETGKGIRKWPPGVSLYNLLCGVIRSDISDLVNRKDNQVGVLEEQDGPTPEVYESHLLRELETELVEKTQNNEKPLQLFRTMEKLAASTANISTHNIRDLTGLSEVEYKNARRVLDRVVQRVLERNGRGSK